MSKKPGLTVLAGPTAVGKGTVSTYIRDNYPEVWLSVSATTRPPRPGEQDGVHYFFKSAEEFDALVADGFAVHGFDYRGHGRADGRRGFCDKWPDYLDDMAAFWERVRKAAEKALDLAASVTSELEQMREWLLERGVTHVAMESTGVYWMPVYEVLATGEMELVVGNAAHIRNVPGRKSDVKDAEWIAHLVRHGLIRPSIVPTQEAVEAVALSGGRRGVKPSQPRR